MSRECSKQAYRPWRLITFFGEGGVVASVFREFVRPSLPLVQKAVILHGIVRRVYVLLSGDLYQRYAFGVVDKGLWRRLLRYSISYRRAIKITGIFKASTLWFKTLNNANIIELNVIRDKYCYE